MYSGVYGFQMVQGELSKPLRLENYFSLMFPSINMFSLNTVFDKYRMKNS